MTRNGSSRPDYFIPGHFGASYEPVVSFAEFENSFADFENSFALEIPYMWGGTTSLEDVFCGIDFFPCPIAI